MVMKPEPLAEALDSLYLSAKDAVVFTDPTGQKFNQKLATELAGKPRVVFVCGHYEGIDQRVVDMYSTHVVSLGDYVLTGGELPALVMADAITRLQPGVLGNHGSLEIDSFADGVSLSAPQYTRPEEFRGHRVPEELLGGDHAKVNQWRLEKSAERTRHRDGATQPVLVIFSGLPGVGKTTVARELSAQLDATYIRIDTVEQSLLQGGVEAEEIIDKGYRAAYALAADNLRLGKSVVADSVNPIGITRDAWRRVAAESGACHLDVEIQCTSKKEHRRRVECRHADIHGHKLPTWKQVITREYQPHTREVLKIDTNILSPEAATNLILRHLPNKR